jgi:pyrroloquinoline quinone biosynthesis protein B
MQLGKEVMGANAIPVWAMPRMDSFLRNNGPWSQLVSLNNIQLLPMHADSSFQLLPSVKITPFIVPHRDEYSETIGFKFETPKKRIIFIPDIDKWDKWNRNIKTEIAAVDLAFLDGTFYKDGEIPGRNMSEIPHPFVEESMRLFESLPGMEKNKIHFIHFNHTNPLGRVESAERKDLVKKGFGICEEDDWFAL